MSSTFGAADLAGRVRIGDESGEASGSAVAGGRDALSTSSSSPMLYDCRRSIVRV